MIKKGIQVEVICGKDKGKKGEVIEILRNVNKEIYEYFTKTKDKVINTLIFKNWIWIELKIDENIFSVIMDATVRNLENKSLDAAYQIAQQKLGLIYNQVSYSPNDQLSIIKSITIDDVKKFWKLIHNNVFIEGSAHGNISKKDSWNPADIWLVKKGK